MRHVDLYDTTLRDGTQRVGVSLSVEDKMKILVRIDRLGVAYIEGGWPGSNPKDAEFFDRARETSLENSTLTAFGMTRRPNGDCDDDPNLRALVESGAPVACIVGKSWTMHVEEALRTTLDHNVAMVADSVRWLTKKGMRVFFDAEHFFDGYRADKAYALDVISAAAGAGAEIVVLCDTNGGTLPHDVERIVSEVAANLPYPIGAHFHDDSGCAVANSLAAVRSGASQVQGCVNGYGERCGNANILTLAADLELKLGMNALPEGHLSQLTDVSHFVAEVCNLPPDAHQPYTGRSAFTHKGGLHISAVLRNPAAYEHLEPSTVGNHRNLVASDLSGVSTLNSRAEEIGLELDKHALSAALGELKRMEADGYSFEAAEGSLELLLRRANGWEHSYFKPLGFRAIVEESNGDEPTAEATVKVAVGGRRIVTAAEGDGPVDALNRALRAALQPIYPAVEMFHLSDYKVRVLNPEAATAAKVRVMIETTSVSGSWTTVGVSENIIEASWAALIDSIVLGLLKNQVEPLSVSSHSAAAL